MSSKFFTNRTKENSLNTRFNHILSNYDIQNLEFLIGYFRISGFNKISKYFQNKKIQKIRILVGINLDKILAENINLFQNENIAQAFQHEQKEIINNSEYSFNVAKSPKELINLLASKKLEVRISREKNIHSKIYIFREKEILNSQNEVIDYRGSVVTGSSNLSHNGLEKNFEFNVELRDSDDIKFALQEFDFLWNDAVNIEAKDIEETINQTFLQRVTPHQIYMRFLFEYFGERVMIDTEIDNLLPKKYYQLEYQKDAVIEGLAKLKKYNGFILGDVVGLGKTVTTAWILKKLLSELSGDFLIITPPALKNEWQKTVSEFEIEKFKRVEIITNGSLNKVKNKNSFSLVVIDESHKFRTESSKIYSELQEITKSGNKKIILVSATPINNSPKDFANQIYLFQDKYNSNIPKFRNLSSFFSDVINTYDEIKKEADKKLSIQEIKNKLEENSKKLIPLIQQLVVRRTRTDLMKVERYKVDLETQKIVFPKVFLKEIDYKLDKKHSEFYAEVIKILNEDLNYSKFLARMNLKEEFKIKYQEEHEVEKDFINKSSLALKNLMKTLFIKRFESSLFAFKMSIERQISNLKLFIEMFEQDEIYISKDLNLSKFSTLESIEELEKEIKGNSFKKENFKENYFESLKKDLKIFEELLKISEENISNDSKIKKLQSELIQKSKSHKVVVFTESEDTLNYLKSNLNIGKTLFVSAKNRNIQRENIRLNFDANVENENKKDDFNIIISTDTLAEGVNLHRAKYIYNFDIPWNSTKLMQRAGRINRIGGTNEEIEIFNFKPTISEKELGLDATAFRKIQNFHYSFGEDSQIYSIDEDVESNELFADLDEVQKMLEEDINPELVFSEELRNFINSNPKEFEKIKSLPEKIAVERSLKTQKNKNIQTVAFVKNGLNRDFLILENNQKIESDFLTVAEILKAEKNEVGQDTTNLHFENIQKLINVNVKKSSSNSVVTKRVELQPSEKKAIKKLRLSSEKGEISHEDYLYLADLIKVGKYIDLYKKVNSARNLSKIVKQYKSYNLFDISEENNSKSEENKENKNSVILSCSFY